jgi:hypothetical protein
MLRRIRLIRRIPPAGTMCELRGFCDRVMLRKTGPHLDVQRATPTLPLLTATPSPTPTNLLPAPHQPHRSAQPPAGRGDAFVDGAQYGDGPRPPHPALRVRHPAAPPACSRRGPVGPTGDALRPGPYGSQPRDDAAADTHLDGRESTGLVSREPASHLAIAQFAGFAQRRLPPTAGA